MTCTTSDEEYEKAMVVYQEQLKEEARLENYFLLL